MPRISRTEQEQQLMAERSPEFLEVLARGLKVIAAFDAERRQLTLSDLARIVDLPRASVRRVLITLESLGYVEADGRLFSLTPRILSLATSYLMSNTVPRVMQAIVDRLSAEAEETCSAAVLQGDEAVFVARAAPRRVIRVGEEIGYRLPVYCSAVGRVLLGQYSEAELDAYLARVPLERLTARTITDPAVLKATVVTSRSEGYVLVDEEAEAGLRSIAVPVRRFDGKIVCALHFGVQVERVSIGRMHDEFLPLLRAGAAEAERLLV